MNKLFVFGLVLACLCAMNIAFALTNSIIYCYDNQTLVENITVYKDSNISTLMLPVTCDWDCDNVTNSCNPPPYQQIGIVFIIICVVIFLGWKFVKWVNR